MLIGLRTKGASQKYKTALRDHLKWIAWKYKLAVQESLKEVRKKDSQGEPEACCWEVFHPVLWKIRRLTDLTFERLDD